MGINSTGVSSGGDTAVETELRLVKEIKTPVCMYVYMYICMNVYVCMYV